MRTTFIRTLCELARTDPRITLLTGDLGFSVLESFANEFPRQYVNAGVAEQNLAGLAAGLALSGRICFTYSIANFPTLRCLEQIRNDIVYHKANVKVVAVGGGFAYGPQGYTHHGVEDIAVMRSLPGMVVLAPGDPVEAKLITEAATKINGPCYIRLGKANEPVVYDCEPDFLVGKAIEVRPGTDICLITTGGILKTAVDAANYLASHENISVRILSMHTVKPIDKNSILSAARQWPILSVEEHSITGGLGSAVAEVLAESGCPTLFRRYGVPDKLYHDIGSQEYLRNVLAGDLISAIKALISKK